MVIDVIAVTDGESDVDTMITNLETVMAMSPDLVISIAYDVNAMVPIFEQVRDAGIKLVFLNVHRQDLKLEKITQPL